MVHREDRKLKVVPSVHFITSSVLNELTRHAIIHEATISSIYEIVHS
jgi:hypothetical protein